MILPDDKIVYFDGTTFLLFLLALLPSELLIGRIDNNPYVKIKNIWFLNPVSIRSDQIPSLFLKRGANALQSMLETFPMVGNIVKSCGFL